MASHHLQQHRVGAAGAPAAAVRPRAASLARPRAQWHVAVASRKLVVYNGPAQEGGDPCNEPRRQKAPHANVGAPRPLRALLVPGRRAARRFSRLVSGGSSSSSSSSSDNSSGNRGSSGGSSSSQQPLRRSLGASFCIGVGLSALGAGGGGNIFGGGGGKGGSGGSGGGGGGDWGASWDGGSGGGAPPQSLGDLALAAAEAEQSLAQQDQQQQQQQQEEEEAVLVLDVSGMKCGGCVGAVTRLLEAHAAVAGVSVNLAAETALVRVRLARAANGGDRGDTDNGGEAEGGGSGGGGGSSSSSSSSKSTAALEALGAELAALLDGGGFGARVRPLEPSAWAAADALAAKRADREARLQRSNARLAVAWALSLLCGVGHLGHVWPAAPAWVHALHHPALSATMSAAALLGPGREILTSGLEGLARGRPDMNTLVGLGAAASFGVSCVAAALPRLGWPTFFEEPAMLLGEAMMHGMRHEA